MESNREALNDVSESERYSFLHKRLHVDGGPLDLARSPDPDEWPVSLVDAVKILKTHLGKSFQQFKSAMQLTSAGTHSYSQLHKQKSKIYPLEKTNKVYPTSDHIHDRKAKKNDR